jgi:hypothetical protein
MPMFTIEWSEMVDFLYTLESDNADEAYKKFREIYPYTDMSYVADSTLIENSITMSMDGYEVELMDYVDN